MAFNGCEEDDVWKCLKHPPKQRPRDGICPECLYDRLIALCPDCANVRPCPCCPGDETRSSSSSSSMMSSDGVDEPLPTEEEDEPNSFRRSRSVAAPCSLRPPAPGARSNSSIWSVFRAHKGKNGKGQDGKKGREVEVEEADGYEQRVVVRSRSVGVGVAAKGSGRGWYFPSPMRAFRQSKTSKLVQQR